MRVSVNQSPSFAVRVSSRPTVVVNQAASAGARELNDLTDVAITEKADGSVLVYSEVDGVFIATKVLEKQEINGGHF